jgi:hypothetical protein
MPLARANRSYAHKALGAGRYPLLSLSQLSESEFAELENGQKILV